VPYLKLIPVHTTVQQSLAYILNPDKTDELFYASSMNCMTNARDAYLEMKSVYEHYSGKKFDMPVSLTGKNPVKAIHYIQSFDPKDNISPELAHRIAKAFARKTFGDDVQVVIATHIDRQHVHNHIIINSYSVSGQKFYANQETLKQAREYSDRVCLAFGIQPYDKSRGKARTVAYHEWKNRRQGTSWKQKIREEIDSLIASVKNLDELLAELEVRGYTIRRGKYISLKAPKQQRAVRLKTLSEDYTPESLASRILWSDVGANAALNDYDPSQLRKVYLEIIGKVIRLSAEKKKVPRKRNQSLPYSPQNDLDVYRLSAQLTIINRDHIRSITHLEERIQSLKSTHETSRREINTLTVQHENLLSLIQQSEMYFDLKDKPMLSEAEKVKLNLCTLSMQNNQISTPSDLTYLKTVLHDTEKKLTALKENFKDCQQKYDLYTDIAKTYELISQGDYISRLVEEERKRQEQENQKKKNQGIP